MLKDMDFSNALNMLKDGNRLRRAGWNGSNQWICLGAGNTANPAANFWNTHTRVFAEQNGGFAEVLPYFILKTAQGAILMGWAPSQSDCLAEDWEIVS